MTNPPNHCLVSGRCRSTTMAMAGLGLALVALTGCSAWDPGVEVRWYTPPGHQTVHTGPSHVRKATSNFTPVSMAWLAASGAVSTWDHTHDRTLHGIDEGSFTRFTLIPGEYEFAYQMDENEAPIYGDIWIAGPRSRRARDFLHHTMLVINPRNGKDGLGTNLPSVLSEDDLRRAAAGDVVSKVVFVADLKAVQGRVVMIDQEIRRLQDEETRLAAQEEYWAVKLADRRRNALYYGNYGDDVPGLHLSLYQLAIGPEAYHWKRMSEADDELRTYQEKIASLRLPVERLREERAALRALLGSVKVLNRQGDLILATPSMTRRFNDPVADITELRRTLQGPRNGLEAPYWFTEIAHTLHWPHIGSPVAIYPRLIETNNRMDTYLEPIGEVLMVLHIGPRPLHRMQ
ncbi:MAG: hypothetical protein GY778_22105 [bacterium]|nr:hypothetical protein [bacterium]